ncbi:helix-turn-helix domain-containing protein [Parabacteroides sp. PF5-9]|uniref:helix-turn-helix transcriptional regulator n=1 Tax=Parabacteroides sp. PF5-9 TaxID=1742404 RepID=UPI0024768480|nr:helix-turn-helix domain-containing protein [Parabacteroides sp. PF5-9]MDH6356952.1 putative DNA-binding transcriptional regulator AlpA [Parabacteroides sp. PF5-9]
MDTKNIDYNTPIACLTVGQFMDAFRLAQENEPIPPQKELPKFLTVPQLAELTGYSTSTINIKNCKKEIPGSKKVCGRVLFDTSVILDWIESGSVKTRSERLNGLEDNFKKKGGRTG